MFATEVRLPLPVGELHWVARIAAVSPDVVPSGPLTQTPESYLEDRSQRAQELYNKVHDRILQAQRRNAERQTSRRSAARGGGNLLLAILPIYSPKLKASKQKFPVLSWSVKFLSGMLSCADRAQCMVNQSTSSRSTETGWLVALLLRMY